MIKTSFNDLKEFVSILKQQNLPYFVFGGFAIEGKRGKIVREHGDIDICCLEKDFEEIKILLENLGYTFFENVNDLKKFMQGTASIDLCLLKKEIEEFSCNLRFVNVKFPSSWFFNSDKVVIENFEFNVACNEIIKKDGLNSKYKEDIDFVKTLPVDNNKMLLYKVKKLPESMKIPLGVKIV
ncbi:MAG: hypothetical protein ABH821_02770 [archaeon]